MIFLDRVGPWIGPPLWLVLLQMRKVIKVRGRPESCHLHPSSDGACRLSEPFAGPNGLHLLHDGLFGSAATGRVGSAIGYGR